MRRVDVIYGAGTEPSSAACVGSGEPGRVTAQRAEIEACLKQGFIANTEDALALALLSSVAPG